MKSESSHNKNAKNTQRQSQAIAPCAVKVCNILRILTGWHIEINLRLTVYSVSHHLIAAAMRPRVLHNKAGISFRRSHSGAEYPVVRDGTCPSAMQAFQSMNHRLPV